MTEIQAARELAALPAEARRVVLDMIALLRPVGSPGQVSSTKSKRRPLNQEKFIGLWRDRSDLTDSAGWVRSFREREWSRQ